MKLLNMRTMEVNMNFTKKEQFVLPAYIGNRA